MRQSGNLILTLLFAVLFYCNSYAQSSPADSVLVIGQVLEDESYTGLPFAHITVKNRATTTDFKGIFKVRVGKSDTVSVSYVGYKTQQLTIPKGLNSPVFETKLMLQKDTIMMENANVMVLPASIEKFKQAILTLELSDQEYRNVEKNMAALTQQVLIYDYRKYSMDAAENQRAAMAGPQSFNFLNVLRKVKDALVDPNKSKDELPTPPPVYYDAPLLPDTTPPDSLLIQKADTTQRIINN
ncbi:MAG: carboxypeptidase-like regulatory domain-containing protein [Imperialibacter sp.]|uniref:carboxypeptidase-like regulatory domain-containing protein n=1 Tax=Imperialibacter sp. TaxID=2038411 RepID=UPI0032EF0430